LLLMGAGVTMSADVPKFDGRGWVVGHQQGTAKRGIIEYVLPGQTVENWKELVTSEVFPPVPVAPFVEKLHASLAQGCPSLVWTVVEQDAKMAIVEWRDAGCGGFEPTSELVRVTIEKDGLFRLAYSVKGRLTPERRKTWLTILGQTPLAERAARDSARETKAASEDAEQAVRMAKVTQVLVDFVQQNGRPCSAPANAELKEAIPGPQGPFSEWLLQCSDARYTVLAQPSGAMTVIRHPGQD
jgi:hypothetical protein